MNFTVSVMGTVVVRDLDISFLMAINPDDITISRGQTRCDWIVKFTTEAGRDSVIGFLNAALLNGEANGYKIIWFNVA